MMKLFMDYWGAPSKKVLKKGCVAVFNCCD
jgi:hypothetical protein